MLSARARGLLAAARSTAPARWAMSRRLLKFTGGSVDDYATLSTPTLSPSC